MVTPERLREILHYDPATGLLSWRPRPETCKGNRIFNRKYAGKTAFTYVTPDGYMRGCINNHGTLAAHRAIWAIMHGRWPEFIDHINGQRSDNRLCNLREVTKAQNAKNQKRRSDNKSGMMGVTWSKEHGRWRARIQDGAKRKHIGMFDTLLEAKMAKLAAEKSLSYGPNHNSI